MHLDRRDLLRLGAAAGLAGAAAPFASAQTTDHHPAAAAQAPDTAAPDGPADYTIRIATGLVELGPETIVSTKLYNGQFPGPLLRFTEGKRVVVDLHNDTDTPEQLHWHGQFLPPEVDGAAEEGTPFIPARGMRRIAFTPRPDRLSLLSHACARRAPISPPAFTADSSVLRISSRSTSPAPTTAKFS